MGQKEEGLSGPQGEAGQGKVRKVTAQPLSLVWIFTAAALPAVESARVLGWPGD